MKELACDRQLFVLREEDDKCYQQEEVAINSHAGWALAAFS